MLGRLAKWLRFLGFDTLYYRDIEDKELVKIARATGRVLLTRDREIPKRYHLNVLLIESEDIKEQLKEVLSVYPAPDSPERRCMVCNEKLTEVEKSKVRDRVPEYIWVHHQTFQACPRCNRVYWEGTHTKNMLRTLRKDV